MEHFNLYGYEQWTDRIYTVTVNLSTVHRITFMVIKGDDVTACIDSAHGADHYLRTFIQQITGTNDQPIIEICTHGGPDHAGGSIQFDEVYCNSGDWPMMRGIDRANRIIDFEPFTLYNKEMIRYVNENMCIEPDFDSVKDIDDGQIFDLGGIKVEAIRTPGHTAGHTAFYIADDKIVFGGDAMNVDTHLARLNKWEMEEYHHMLHRFMARIDPDSRIWTAHLNRPHKMRVPINIAEACLDLAYGRGLEEDPPAEAIQKFFGPSGFNNPDKRMHYHNNCCVIYNRVRLDDPRPWEVAFPPKTSKK